MLAGIRASLEHATGPDDLAGRSVLVEGAGEVGRALAGLLHEAGTRVLVTDVDANRSADVAASLPGSVRVEASEAMSADCDVFAPCAVGAILNPTTIPELRCSVVAGSANNQLLSDDDAEALRRRGILYAPDFVINSGGLKSLQPSTRQSDCHLEPLSHGPASGTRPVHRDERKLLVLSRRTGRGVARRGQAVGRARGLGVRSRIAALGMIGLPHMVVAEVREAGGRGCCRRVNAVGGRGRRHRDARKGSGDDESGEELPGELHDARVPCADVPLAEAY